MTVAVIFLAVTAVVAVSWCERQKTLRLVREARRETRRQLVAHLRANHRGLTVLDNVTLVDVEAPGPLAVIGDHVTVSGCRFTRTGLEVWS